MNRIDEIFSLKKLRENWKQPQAFENKVMGKKAHVLLTKEGSRAVDEHENLRKQINQRFPGEKSIALNIMMEEIKVLMLKIFSSETIDDKDEICLIIDEKLNNIEDIIEALEMGAAGLDK